jgi:tetratricopeptide (TPR) repeat protein
MYSFLLGSVSIYNAESQDNSSRHVTEYENVTIKTIDPTDMVSPTENERAMTAYNIGTYLMYQNRLDEAEVLLKEAIDLDPVFVDAIDHLGIVYRRQNRLKEAEQTYLKSIELNKINKVPFINLAVVYRLQNRLNDAFQLYIHVAQTHPNDPEGYYGMGEIFYIVGDYENALQFFDMAVNLYLELGSSLVFDAFYYIGMIYYETDEYDEALKYLEEAKKGNPNNQTIQRTINEIKNR